MFDVLRNLVGGLLLLIAFYVTLGNFVDVVNYYRIGKNASQIPLIGGASGAVGCWMSTSEMLHSYWWLPLVFDPGCALLLGWTFCWLTVQWLKGAWRK